VTAVVAATVCLTVALVTLVWSLRPVGVPIRSAVRAAVPGSSDRSPAMLPSSVDELRIAAARRCPGAAAEVDRWLRLTDGSMAMLVRRITMGGAAGGAAAGLVCVGTALGSGLGADLLPGLGLLLSGVAGGVAVPIARLRRRAHQARRQAARAVGTTLDLVVMCLAGGMGVEGALQAAAGIGDDPFSRRLSTALAATAAAGVAPWDRLSALGDELGVAELVELGSAIALAGTEGARVRSTLAAKADALRTRQLAIEETAANTVTERMFLPGVLLLVGFLLFIGYPAVARILSGL
jgi:tight adherence protein C